MSKGSKGSKGSKVTFIQHLLLQTLQAELDIMVAQKFAKGSRIAVKLHMGEYGSLFYLRPVWARVVVDRLKFAGFRPFLFDSPTVYTGSRHTPKAYLETAKKNGFTEDTIGCPIVVSDEPLPLNTGIGRLDACKPLLDADGILVLSHFKGHACSGFGGAIKNIAMGGFTSQSKGKQHAGANARITAPENCVLCGACVKACPFGLLKISDNNIVMERCMGCGACLSACPNNVFSIVHSPLSNAMAHACNAFIGRFGKNKLIYVNVLMDIAHKCDCVATGFSHMEIRLVAPNLGVLISDDIVAVDKAALDLVDKATSGQFRQLWHADPYSVVELSEKLGDGNGSYQLIEK
jgi:uncharacterized protein